MFISEQQHFAGPKGEYSTELCQGRLGSFPLKRIDKQNWRWWWQRICSGLALRLALTQEWSAETSSHYQGPTLLTANTTQSQHYSEPALLTQSQHYSEPTLLRANTTQSQRYSELTLIRANTVQSQHSSEPTQRKAEAT